VRETSQLACYSVDTLSRYLANQQPKTRLFSYPASQRRP